MDSLSFLNSFSERWLVSPIQLSFPTLAQTSSYATEVGLPDAFFKNTGHFVNSAKSKLCRNS